MSSLTLITTNYRIDLPTAEQVVLACAVRYRLPEPIRLADQLVKAAKRHNMAAGSG